jgi:hypothetical protein
MKWGEWCPRHASFYLENQVPLASADEEGGLVDESEILEANPKVYDEFLQNDGVYCHGDVPEESQLDSSR